MKGGALLIEQIYTLEPTFEQWANDIQTYGMLYIHAMQGYGKTSQAEVFAQERYKIWTTISANQSNFIERLQDYFKSQKQLKSNKLLIIDDLHLLNNTSLQDEFANVLRIGKRSSSHIDIILLSCVELPSYLLHYRLTRLVAVYDYHCLLLTEEQIISVMKTKHFYSSLSSQDLHSYAKICSDFSRGHALSAIAYLDRLAQPGISSKAACDFARKDLYEYFNYLFSFLEPSQQNLYLELGVFSVFSNEMADTLTQRNTQADIINALSLQGFMFPTSSNQYRFEPNFLAFIQRKIQIELGETAIANFNTAGALYTEGRQIKKALHSYEMANNFDKIIELIIFLCENADGSNFLDVIERYIQIIPADAGLNNMRLVGAKALFYAYSMNKDAFYEQLTILKDQVEIERKNKVKGDTLEVYIRTSIASPISDSETFKTNLFLFSDFLVKHNMKVKNIMPSGNLPSIMNGGLDLLPWANTKPIFQKLVKKTIEFLFDENAYGAYDAALGELYYERNNNAKALDYITRALHDSNTKGSIRIQYTSTGILSRIFMNENQPDIAIQNLKAIYDRADSINFNEMLPNIEANIIDCKLHTNDTNAITEWVNEKAPNEHEKFYTTKRYVLYMKVKSYIALGKYVDALYIISLLEPYAKEYSRPYLQIQLAIQKSIIYYRIGEEWQKTFLEAVENAQKYKIIRVLSDEGNAIMPLIKAINWRQEDFNKTYLLNIIEETEMRAKQYPNYLRTPKKYMGLTKKEVEVLEYIVRGFKNAQIADELGVNLGTVKFHVGNIMKKFGVGSRILLAKIAKEESIV